MSLPTLLFMLLSSLIQPGMEAQEAPATRCDVSTYKNLLDKEPALGLESIVRDISRTYAASSLVMESDVVASDVTMGFVVWPPASPLDDIREPRTAFVVESGGSENRGWPIASLLAIMDAMARNPPETGACFFIVDRSAVMEPDADMLPDASRRNLRSYLADVGIGTVVLLDINGPPVRVAMKFSSRRMQAPLHLVELSKKAAAQSGGSYGDDGVGQLLAVSGLNAGSEMLGPWLSSGIPALALESSSSLDMTATELNLADFALKLTAMVPDRSRDGFDRGYLRYPLPAGSIIIDDSTIVIWLLAVSLVVGVTSSIGILGDRRRTVSPGGLLREVLTALVLSFLSLWVVASVVKLVMGAVSGSLLDGLMQAGKEFPGWASSFSLALRFGAFLSAYYAFSGLASRFGLLGPHGRLEAAWAAMALFCTGAVASMALLPPVVPFFLMALLLVAFTAQSAAASGLGLFVVVSVLLPYLVQVVFASAGTSGPAVIILEAGIGGILVMAGLAAPFILWTVAASSPAASLRRGRRTAAAWAVSSLLFSLGEAAIRTALQFR